MASHVENYDQSNFWVNVATSFRSSARLHLQHFLMQNTLGYLIEPAVEKSLTAESKHLKIADLGCANGVWLNDLHSHLTKNNITAQLDGFDINPIHFPAAAYLPSSVSLKQLDIISKPVPAELLGTYDLVHVRAFVSSISNLDALTHVFSVASSLLKPGGFLQWEETRGDVWFVESPSPEISKATCDSIVQVLTGSQKARGINNDWVDSLDTHLSKFGFEHTKLLAQEKRKQDFKGWTEDYLMVWADIIPLFPTKAQAPDAPLTRETWIDMFNNGVKETEKGVVVHQGRIITAVGQKAK